MGAPDATSDKKRKISIPDEALSLEEMKVSRQKLLDLSKSEKHAVDRINNTLKELVELINEERIKEHIPMNSEEFERCRVRAEVESIISNRDGLQDEVVKTAKELLDFVGLFEQRLPLAKPTKKKAGKDNRERERERERDFPKIGNKTNIELRRMVEDLQRRVSKLEDMVRSLQKSK